MPREILTCPYCNSSVALTAPGQPGERIQCPRCEETFPYRPGIRIEQEPAPEGRQPDRPEGGQGWSNGAVALAILAGMATMAVLSLTFAELTTPLRRSHDVAIPGRRLFELPTIALGAMLIYVVVLGSYIGRLLGRRERPLSRPAGVGAVAVLALLAAIGLADIYGMARRLIGVSAGPAVAGPATGGNDTSPAAVEPAQLAALAYLPSDTNVLLGVQVREALEQPLGKEILERWQAGPGEATLAAMAQWTGLELADLDHLIIGLKVDGSLLPRFRVIVRTNRDHDRGQLRAALKAGRPATRLEKTIYRFTIPQTLLEAVVWFADDRTLVFALAAEDLDDMPLQPGEGLARFPAPLQQAVAEMNGGTFLWLAGHSSDWQKSLQGIPFLQVPKEAETLLREVRTFAGWMQLSADVSFHLALGCADAESAGKVSDYLMRQGFEPGKPLPFLGHRPETRALAQELAHSLQRSREGEWIFMKTNVTTASISQALR
jgi:hypothetical protein